MTYLNKVIFLFLSVVIVVVSFAIRTDAKVVLRNVKFENGSKVTIFEGSSEPGGGGSVATSVDDVFSAYVYTGNAGTQTINNSVDLAGQGGMVWIKSRDNTPGSVNHNLIDTERGVSLHLSSNTIISEEERLSGLTAFNSNGFALGSYAGVNAANDGLVSWTFRKAPNFFDVVRYTGDGVAGREIAHSLGVLPGMIFVRETSAEGGNWWVYHRSLGATKRMILNANYAEGTQLEFLNNTEPTTTNFTVGNYQEVNDVGDEYIAYLFAHDDSADSMIKCGSYIGNGSVDGPEIDLGWEPQYVMIKNASTAADWFIIDVIRGWSNQVGNSAELLRANSSAVEDLNYNLKPISTGFKIDENSYRINQSGDTYIYMTIRRPMIEPTSSSDVFAIDTADGSVFPTYKSNFITDTHLLKATVGSGSEITNRITQGASLRLDTVDAGVSGSNVMFDYMNGCGDSSTVSNALYGYMFRRAKVFFDVVCYAGDGVAGRTVNHNLAVVPEMVWIKSRSSSSAWSVYHADQGIGEQMVLNTNAAKTTNYLIFSSLPTSSEMVLTSYNSANESTQDYIAYLFATVPGISKVGSYTGNGANQTINCGFGTGTKYLIIKRIDASGDWYMYDSVRGIVTGNDPFLKLNTTDAEVTNDDSVDPDSSGFIVNQTGTTNLNVNGGEYIYYAIAE